MTAAIVLAVLESKNKPNKRAKEFDRQHDDGNGFAVRAGGNPRAGFFARAGGAVLHAAAFGLWGEGLQTGSKRRRHGAWVGTAVCGGNSEFFSRAEPRKARHFDRSETARRAGNVLAAD